MKKDISRREFLASTTAAIGAVHIVPRHVVGGPGQVAPSDKVALAHIGCGTQGLRELPALLENPELQVVAVCDPNRDTNNYLDWSKDTIKYICRGLMDEPNWREGVPGVPGGRDVMKEVLEKYYARTTGQSVSIPAYADFRDLIENEDFDAVKIMTPDHLHATISIACMQAGKHVSVHKPLANRMNESKRVIETARQTGVETYYLPRVIHAPMDQVMAWIDGGLIGTLREIQSWTHRPVWPQYLRLPEEQPPIPDGFDWDLWLGPEKWRPYHPHYTHNVFRGWYDFGGGSFSDVCHYSLWPVLRALELKPPIAAEAHASHAVGAVDNVCERIENDYSFPLASQIRFSFAPAAGREAVDIRYSDGSMKPPKPEELKEDGEPMGREGMLFVGDKGKILTSFNGFNPRLLPKRKMEAVMGPQPEERPGFPGLDQTQFNQWIKACKGGEKNDGTYLQAETISEMGCLAAVALRAGERVEYDTEKMEITNLPEANKYLTRDYREGWELG